NGDLVKPRREVDDRVDDGELDVVIGEAADEGTVDLDDIRGDLPEVAVGRQPRAEVVKRQPATQVAHRLEELPGHFHVADGGRLRDFEADQLGGDAVV